MKRIIAVILCACVAGVSLLTACERNNNETTTEENMITYKGTTEKNETTEKDGSGDDSRDKTTTEATTEKNEEPTTPPVSNPSSQGEEKTVGVSSKGYNIIEINGITYINGILVVNKTYSLPASFTPGSLTNECYAAFTEMQKSAAEDGADIYISSGYRSYSLQSDLYSRYSARDGAAAVDKYSARPGHSEHQTGLAIDLNTISYSFADTAEGKWIAENCWKYGFILRYTENDESKTGYNYEPWHIRYIGEANAKAVYDSGLCLEEYLGITSVYD